jgi:hypothetical protein
MIGRGMHLIVPSVPSLENRAEPPKTAPLKAVPWVPSVPSEKTREHESAGGADAEPELQYIRGVPCGGAGRAGAPRRCFRAMPGSLFL